MADQLAAHSVGRYVSTLRHQWRIVAVGALIGIVASVGYLAVIGVSYTARTDVNINVISTDPFNAQRSASGLLDGITEAQIATSHAVAVRVAKRLGVSASQLRENLDATVIPDATVIRITYTASSPDAAQDGADAIADAYLAYRSEQANERLNIILDGLAGRVADRREALIEANARLSAAVPDSTEANQAVSDRQLVTVELDNLLAQTTTTESIDTSGGSVLTESTENPLTIAPSKAVLLASGLLGGLALGVVAAFVVNALRHRIRDSDDAALATGIRVLVELPGGDATIPDADRGLDRIRVARERIQSTFEPVGQVIAVLIDVDRADSAEPAANLALSFAETGLKTRLAIPAPSAALSAQIRSTKHPLELVELGQTPSPPGRGDLTDGIREMVRTASSDTVTVLVVPATADFSSRVTASRLADALVMVVTLDVSRKDRVATVLDELLEVGGSLLGAIVVPRSRHLVARTGAVTQANGTPTPAAESESSPQPEKPSAPAPTRSGAQKTTVVTKAGSTSKATPRAKQGTPRAESTPVAKPPTSARKRPASAAGKPVARSGDRPDVGA